MSGYKSLKRIIHRCCEEIDATLKIAKVTSWREAITTFQAKLDIQIMNHNGFKEPSEVERHLKQKHNTMLKYYETTCGDFFASYDYDREIIEDDPEFRNCIWTCWWQGIESAPLVVKKCINSIIKSSGHHKVIIITEDNYKNYTHIPEWIEIKKKEGIISRTHFSDILRLSLLAEHGGMWLDSTFFCAGNCNLDDYFKYPLWSIKRPDYLHCSVASGYFATYSLQCGYENRWMFATMRDFFLYYWETNNILIDYLTLDYMIVLAQKHDERIAQEFSAIVPNNPECDELYKALGAVYDREKWDELSENTALFKLTWKQDFPETQNGLETFYGRILGGKL